MVLEVAGEVVTGAVTGVVGDEVWPPELQPPTRPTNTAAAATRLRRHAASPLTGLTLPRSSLRGLHPLMAEV